MANSNSRTIPAQEEGAQADLVEIIKASDQQEAKLLFLKARERLFNISHWASISEGISASFILTDKRGESKDGFPETGDYIRIDIPGPGTRSGDGFDWVQVEAVEQVDTAEKESFGFRVRPAQNPQNQASDVAHFYSPESTSTFTVTRENTKLHAAIYDRNTKVNKPAGSVADKVRDAVIGTAGILSFSKIQWKALTEGLLQPENDQTAKK